MAEFNRATLRKVFEDAGMEIPPKDVLGQICDLHTAKTDEMKDTVKELTKRAEKAEQERDALEAQGDIIVKRVHYVPQTFILVKSCSVTFHLLQPLYFLIFL